MSLKEKYEHWDQITESIRPIWEANNGQIRGKTDLWKIIHAIGANPDLWQEAMDVVPIVRAQHEWLFNKKASKLDEDLREIKNRIARGDPITRPGKEEYNKPAYRAVMGIKDVWMNIKDNNRTVDLPDVAISSTDIFNDVGVYDEDTETKINILRGLVQIYQDSNGPADVIKELIEHCLNRIDELRNPKVELVTVWEQFTANLTLVKPADNTEEAIFAVACQQSKKLNELKTLAVKTTPHLVDVDQNPLNTDDVWFGQVEFVIPKEDYMLFQLGQTK